MAGRGEVVFSWQLSTSECREAYQWHRGFSSSNDYLFPRSWDAYRAIAEAGRVVSVKCDGEFLGLAHYFPDGANWEIGGLMVATSERGNGVGPVLSRVRLAHLLFDEDPFLGGGNIITHVHAENQAPRRLLTESLKFKHRGRAAFSGSKYPGLKADAEGNVWGDEFEIDRTATPLSLATWCEAWTGTLKDKRKATIVLGEGISLSHWAQAFRQMSAVNCEPTR